MMAAGKKEPDESKTDSQGINRMLRADAEEQLTRAPKITHDLAGQTPEQLIHELQVHQIELETQAEELRRAHIMLEESRDKFLDLYDFAPTGYLTLNEKALIIEANLTGATLLGIERRDLISAQFGKFIAEKDSDEWYRYFMNVKRQDHKQTCTLTLKRGDGSMFPARLEGIRLTGSDGITTARIAISDISDIWQIEALKESEEKYRALFAAESDGIFVVDKESGIIIDCNDAVTPMYGYRKDEVIGQPNTTMSAEPEATRAATLEVEGRIPVRYHKRKDGSFFPVEIAASVVSVKGHDAIVAAVRDITERKVAEEALRKSEERYRAIYDQSPIAIELFDATGVLVHVNPACLNLFGLENRQAIQNFSLFSDPNITDDQKEKLRGAETVHYQGPFDFEKVKTLNLYPTSREGIIWLDVLITPMGGRVDAITGFLLQIQDITEGRRNEMALRQSEEKLSRILNDITDVVWSLSWPDMKVYYISPSAEKLYGRPVQEFIDKPSLWAEITHPDDKHISEKALEQLRKEGSALRECRIVRPDGTIVWIHDKSKFIFDEHDTPIRVDGISSDITDRKQVEEALHEASQYTRSLIDVSLDPLVTISYEGRIMDVNAATERITGYTRDHLIGTDFLDYFTDTERAKEGYQKVFADGIVRDYLLEIKNRDGTIRQVLYNAAVYRDGSGTVKGVFAAAHDITDKKVAQDALQTSELQYRRLFETAQDGILILDEETGTIIDANTFLIDMLGYPLEYFVGKLLRELGFIKDKTLAQRAFTELKTNGYIRYEDLPLETIDGRSIDVEFISNVYLVNSHKIIQCNIRDITARKFAEDALALANKKLAILSGITRHDINNQLTVQMGYLSILEKKQPDPTLNEYFSKVSTATQRISSMIQFTKEYEEIGVHAPAWQDCRTLVDTAAKQAPLGQVTVKNDLPAGAEVFADPLIIKVFFNLMDNAARYGGKITTLRFSVEEHGGDRIIVCEDDGDGVVAVEKEKIFERGFGKNTGLGLALSREILDITGITIRETGELGTGARFEMVVPKGAWRIAGKGD